MDCAFSIECKGGGKGQLKSKQQAVNS